MTKVLLTGGGGQLGPYVAREAAARFRGVIVWRGRADVDLADAAAVRRALAAAKPDLVIHVAALASIKDCFESPERARAVNVEATRIFAGCGARLVFTSTDMVFDGERAPYAESSAPSPLTMYGRTKLEGEVAAGPSAAVVRLALMAGARLDGKPSYFADQLAALRAGKAVRAFSDEFRSCMEYAAAARALVAVAASSFTGVLHLGGPERLSRYDLMRRAAKDLGLDDSLVVAASQKSLAAPEPRPRDLTFDTTRLRQLFPAFAPPPVGFANLGQSGVVGPR